MVKRSLAADSLHDIFLPLQRGHQAFASRYPGPRGDRQPVHTVYGGAHLFRADTAQRLGEKALEAMDEYAPDFISFARAIELSGSQHLGGSPGAAALAKSIQANPEAARKDNRPAWFACALYQRVREKLQREPVEDFRIDFEDGFGNRRMRKRIALRPPPLENSLPEWRRGACRRSLGYGSSRLTRNYEAAAYGRWIFS